VAPERESNFYGAGRHAPFKFGRGLWTKKKTAPKNNCTLIDVVVKFCEIFICPTFK
jgi:hypothetical protein